MPRGTIAPTQPRFSIESADVQRASVACRRQHTATQRPPQTSHHSLLALPLRPATPPSQTTWPLPTFSASPPFPHALPGLASAGRQLPLAPRRRCLRHCYKPRGFAVPAALPPVAKALHARPRRASPLSRPPRHSVADRRRRPQRSFPRSNCRNPPSTGGRCHGSKDVQGVSGGKKAEGCRAGGSDARRGKG